MSSPSSGEGGRGVDGAPRSGAPERYALRPEAFTFNLSVAGRPAGESRWQVQPERGGWQVRVQTDFHGVLPEVRKVQVSRVHPFLLLSAGYTEGDGRRVSFETLVDRKTGVLTLKQGKDEASAPLLTDIHDPVSVLLWLRAYAPERTDVMMAGGRVHVLRLADITELGVNARAYELRPGGALVFVEDAAPWRLLRLVQPTDFGPVDAVLRPEPHQTLKSGQTPEARETPAAREGRPREGRQREGRRRRNRR